MNTSRFRLGLLLACTLGCTASPPATEAADAFEVHLATIDGLASVSNLARDLGEEQALDVLHEVARRTSAVMLEPDGRLCVKGAVRYGKDGAFTGQTLALHDLSLADGWDQSTTWFPADMRTTIDAVQFRSTSLVVTWHLPDMVPRTVEIPWAPGTRPSPGLFE